MKNSIKIFGRIGSDLEIKTTKSGKKYVNFPLAERLDKENTNWHNCVVWEKTAETLINYCQKGCRINVQGSLMYSEYEKDGVKIKSSKIDVYEFDIIDFKEKPNPLMKTSNESFNEADELF